jgi:trk system potassium uptake protein TrkH
MIDLLPVTNVLGRLMAFFSLAYGIPIAASLIYADGLVEDYVYAMALTAASGFAMYGLTRRHYRELKPRDGFVLVVATWTQMTAIATIPLLIVYPDMSFTDAFFETMSALTTTGATVMTGLDDAPPSINLWRHALQWLGGMGIIVLAVAVLPLLGVGGRELYKAEVPGPMKDAHLTARIADTAKALWLIYFALTVACALALRVAGMSWLDAVSHAFSALSLGGFSTRDASVGAFDDPVIEAVLIVFMVAAALNFASHFAALHARSLRPLWRDAEARAVLGVLVMSILAVSWYLLVQGTYADYPTALRHVAFNLVSVATDCGYASQDFASWPVFAPLWMIFLSCVTVSSGSTGGGIKMIRTLTLARQASHELTRMVHPAVVKPVKIGGNVLPPRIVQAMLGFIFLYFMTVVVMTFTLIVSGLDFITALTAVIASINNMGPGMGEVAANYAGLTDFQKWMLVATMLIGRLEVLSVLVLFTVAFWRK